MALGRVPNAGHALQPAEQHEQDGQNHPIHEGRSSPVRFQRGAQACENRG